ncbi:MAG: hypothetical protein Q9164_004926 [Protoblastenia rupestris]
MSAANSVITSPTSIATPPGNPPSQGLSVGSQVGIAIAFTLAGVSLLGALIWFLVRKRPSKEIAGSKSDRTESDSSNGEEEHQKPEMSGNQPKHELAEQKHRKELPGIPQYHKLSDKEGVRELEGSHPHGYDALGTDSKSKVYIWSRFLFEIISSALWSTSA